MDLPSLITALTPHWLTAEEQRWVITKPGFSKDGNPVICGDDNMWYFFDETWTEVYGPYQTQEEANEGCSRYASTL